MKAKYFLKRYALLLACLGLFVIAFFMDFLEKEGGISLDNMLPQELGKTDVFQEKVRVVKVYDGDTLDVVTDKGEKMKIRLYGIDAPEKGQKFADTARIFLRDLTEGQEYTIDVYYKDKYKRYVAALFDDNGIALQEDLVRNGFAWVYPRFCEDVMLCVNWENAEDEAVRTRQGLWQEKNPTSPWDYKRGNR